MILFPQFTVWSGGQTGVDQGALEAAQALGIPVGGWCPKGRKAENGTIPQHFPLKEHASAKYPPRTKQNIRESDGTLILGWGSLGEQGVGTKLTDDYAHACWKPCLYMDLKEVYKNASVTSPNPFQEYTQVIQGWLKYDSINILNVAGPRESRCPGIQKRTMNFLVEVFQSYRRH